MAEAIDRTLPTCPDDWRTSLFSFARELKAIPGLANAKPKDLQPAVVQWHSAAADQNPDCGIDPGFTLVRFFDAWACVEYAAGRSLMDALERARVGDPVPGLEGCGDKVQMLAAVCRELQRLAGDEPFFLACRAAGQAIDVSFRAAADYLRLLVTLEVLQLVERGSMTLIHKGGDRKKMTASKYRYLGSDL